MNREQQKMLEDALLGDSKSRRRIKTDTTIVHKTSTELLTELFESFGTIFKEYEETHKRK
jgi:hypothetical protein